MRQQKTVLRQIRRANDWTLDYVSLKTGVDHATLSLVERRLKKPSPAVLKKLERFFKVPAEQLMADAERAA